MVRATERKLAAPGVGDPDVVLADAGYWHQRQMQQLAGEGVSVLVPPDAGLRRGPRPGWTGGMDSFMCRVLETPAARTSTGSVRSRSSPCSARSSSTARSNASNAVAEPPAAANGDIAATHDLLRLHDHRLAAATS